MSVAILTRDLKEECCQSLSANLAVDQVIFWLTNMHFFVAKEAFERMVSFLVQVVDILVLSDLHKAVELKATAISFLLAHKEEVFSQPDWKIKLKVV